MNAHSAGNHEIPFISLATACGETTEIAGEIIAMLNQHVHYGEGKTMHSSRKIESRNNAVDTKSIKTGSNQNFIALENCTLPILIKGGFLFIPIRSCADKEWDELLHVFLTSDKKMGLIHIRL